MILAFLASPPTLASLCKELGGVAGKWFLIGLHSGVPYEKLQEFKKEEYPLAAVFNYCLRGNVKDPLTWTSIVDTLKSVDENGLAEQLNKKYCQTDLEKGAAEMQDDPIVGEPKESMTSAESLKHRGR